MRAASPGTSDRRSITRRLLAPSLLAVVGGLLLGVVPADPGGTRNSRDRVNAPEASAGHRSAIGARRYAARTIRRQPGSAEKAQRATLPRAIDFPQDVPAEELRPAASLSPDPARDTGSVVAGKADGRVVVIHWEDRVAKSQVSSDSGATFLAESLVPTGPPALDVDRVVTEFNVDNGTDTIYVALVVADPGGDLGLQVVRSGDFGVNWESPVDLVRDGDDTHGVDDAVISSNSSGVVAVVYREGRGGDPYARVSTDSGNTWGARVRLNGGVSDGAGSLGEPLWVEVDGAGNVHATFVEDRGSGRQVFYTRSTDSGAIFEAEREFDAIVGARTDSTNPIMQSAFDGSILLAFWDAAGNDHIYVLRSTDAGVNFSLELDRTFGNEDFVMLPMLFASTVNDTVVAHFIDGTGELTTQRSTDNGASYGPVRTISSSSALQPSVGLDAATVTRTGAGTLAIAYTDFRSDPYLGNLTDLYVQVSTNEANTWGSESRVDGTVVGTAGTALRIPGMSAVGTDALVLVYADNRGGSGAAFDVYSNRSAAATPSFVNEQRIDSDTGDRDRNVFNTPSVAVGPSCAAEIGVENVYMAMAVVSGAEPEIRVAVSGDGGHTFANPVRVSDTSGDEFAAVPRIVAPSDGSVHVAYTVIDSASGDVELRYNKSDDCGQTWMPSETNFGLATQGEFDLIAPGNGEVYVIWSENGFEIRMRKSIDGGDTFAPSVFVNTNLSGFNRNPVACLASGVLFVAFAAPDGTGDWFTTFVAASGDGGATFEPEIKLMFDMASGGSFEHTLDCYESTTGSPGIYAAVMANSFSSSPFAYVRWFEFDTVGGTLSALPRFVASPGADYGEGSGVLCLNTEPGPGSCLFLADESVSDPNGRPNRIALREYGSTGFLVREHLLTAAAPLPQAGSASSRMVGDGQGNVWVSWLDSSAGLPEMVVRHSADSGQTFDAPYRLSRAEPQGTKLNSIFDFIKKGYSAAAAGEAFFVWGGQRESTFFSGLFGVYDTDDFDRDLTLAGIDCNDSDPTAQAAPTELTDLQVEKIADGIRVSWDSQASTAGSGTVYDLVTGGLDDLRVSGDFATAQCLLSGGSGSSVDQIATDPPSGEGIYYLGRATSSCGASSYGDSTIVPDPRDGLDIGGPCP